MKSRRRLVILGEEIKLGETRDLRLKFSENYLGHSASIPMRIIRGVTPGPRLFLTGAIHGDELSGIGIIRELLYGEPPEIEKGTLICVPVVNLFGLEYHSRYLPDRRDLNRCFPGGATGSLSSRLANAIYQEIVRKCDYGIDFHSAALRRTNYPNVRADMRNPRVKSLARSFGCELIVDGRGPEGSLRRTATSNDIPTIILEAGEVWKNEPGVVEIGVRGCMNVLKWLGMIQGQVEKPLFQTTITRTTWVRAERGGFLGFHARPGDLVEADQPLATNYNIFGRERRLLTSPTQGIVLGMTTMPAVKPGEPVYHIAELNPRTHARIRKQVKEAGRKHLYRRLQEDLATNINLTERNDVENHGG